LLRADRSALVSGGRDAAADGEPSARRNGAASGGAEISRLARIVLGVALRPYTARLASSSGLSTPPDRSIPAKGPFEREYDRISAVSAASVPTAPRRPSGPAATDASAPSVTLFLSSLSTPDSFITSITRSTCSAPAWNPQLPFASCMNRGALHVSPERQLLTPLPYSP